MGISFYSEWPSFDLGVFLLKLQNFLFLALFLSFSSIIDFFYRFLQTDFIFLQISANKQYFYCDFVFLQTDFIFLQISAKKEFNFPHGNLSAFVLIFAPTLSSRKMQKVLKKYIFGSLIRIFPIIFFYLRGQSYTPESGNCDFTNVVPFLCVST